MSIFIILSVLIAVLATGIQNTQGIRRTTNNECCELPFYSKKIWYNDCTTVGNNGVPWCGTVHLYPIMHKKWGICATNDCRQPKPLGVESGKLPDDSITASSEWDVNHGAANGRLNYEANNGRSGAWSALTNDENQWIQFDFKYDATLDTILTQGRAGTGQWVKSYTLSYSNDGINFEYYKQKGITKVILANYDGNTIFEATVCSIISARYVRLHPVDWNGHISMRVGFMGCFIGQSCAAEPCENSGHCIEEVDTFRCTCLLGYNGDRCQTKSCEDPKPLGVENGKMPDDSITASSEWASTNEAANGRLDFQPTNDRAGAWSARTLNVNQWIQFDFKYDATVGAILTQGRAGAGQWVTSYTVSYSNDGINFEYYEHRGIIKVFNGNIDGNSIVEVTVSPVIVARYVRLQPKTWHGFISMRAGFRGCLADD